MATLRKAPALPLALSPPQTSLLLLLLCNWLAIAAAAASATAGTGSVHAAASPQPAPWMERKLTVDVRVGLLGSKAPQRAVDE